MARWFTKNLAFVGALALTTAVCGQTATPGSSADQYVEIPLVGDFSKDALAKGVFEALSPAKRRGVGHVVFMIDIRGGQLADAEAVLDVLDSFERDFTYHGVIQGRAEGAAVWVLAACDHLYLTDKPPLGMVVGSFQLPSTGDEAADASAVVGMVAAITSRAQSNGHATALFRAMVERAATVYLKEAAGQPTLVGAQPQQPFEVIDSTDTFLSMTAKQVQRAGVARSLQGSDAAALGKLLDIATWKKSLSPSGVSVMRMAARDLDELEGESKRRLQRIERLTKDIESMPTTVSNMKALAEKAEPSARDLAYFEETGQLTDASRRQWQIRTDLAVARWRDVQDRLKDLDGLEKGFRSAVDAYGRSLLDIGKFRRWREPPILPVFETPKHGVDKDAEWVGAQQEIERLLRMRGRYKI